MTQKPAYAVHEVDEDDVTVDWFFGHRPYPGRLLQVVLVLVGWVFAVLPVVITVSALVHRHDPGGWWNYHEGFVMFDVTMRILAVLTVVFVVGFLVLYLLNRSALRRHADEVTYQEERLALRLELADELYANKFGDGAERVDRRNVRIEPYGDLETYELRARYRTYGVD